VRIRQRGEEQLAQQHQHIVRELRLEIGGLASRLAERIVREHVADEGNRRATVDRFLEDLESTSARTAEPAVAAGAGEGVPS
jgi:F0F1-type ATP synthase membrane subunit b/b'